MLHGYHLSSGWGSKFWSMLAASFPLPCLSTIRITAQCANDHGNSPGRLGSITVTIRWRG